MKITGSATLHAPPPQVWAALTDPAVLARTIPGCDHLEVTGPGSVRLIATAAVASTQGTYMGDAEVSDRQEPTSFRLTATAAGAPGTLTATAQVRLEPAADGTKVTYDADAIPEGLIARVGQQLLASTANKLAAGFFTSMDDLLMGGEAGSSAAPPRGVRAGGAAGVSSPAAPPTRGASGLTPELPAPDPQPAGRTGARPPTRAFLQGALAGAAAVLAGVIVARHLGRRSR